MKRSFNFTNEDRLLQVSKSKNRLGTGSDASFGLTQKQIEIIKQEFNKTHPDGGTLGEKWYFKPFVKRKPLLMIYFVGLNYSAKDEAKLDKGLNDIPLIGLSIGIPSLTDKNTEYVTYYLNVIDQLDYLDYRGDLGDDLNE